MPPPYRMLFNDGLSYDDVVNLLEPVMWSVVKHDNVESILRRPWGRTKGKSERDRTIELLGFVENQANMFTGRDLLRKFWDALAAQPELVDHLRERPGDASTYIPFVPEC